MTGHGKELERRDNSPELLAAFADELREALYCLDLYTQPSSHDIICYGAPISLPTMGTGEVRDYELGCMLHYSNEGIAGHLNLSASGRLVRRYHKAYGDEFFTSTTGKEPAVTYNTLLKFINKFSDDNRAPLTEHARHAKSTSPYDFLLSIRSYMATKYTRFAEKCEYVTVLDQEHQDNPETIVSIGHHAEQFPTGSSSTQYIKVRSPAQRDGQPAQLVVEFHASDRSNMLYAYFETLDGKKQRIVINSMQAVLEELSNIMTTTLHSYTENRPPAS